MESKHLTWESMNWNNRYEVKTWVSEHVIPGIYETLVDSYGFTSEDYDDDSTFDNVHEIIDGLPEVIYNYQAKKIAEAFDMDVFDDSPVTGERYSSYNVMAYEKIEEIFTERYHEQLYA